MTQRDFLQKLGKRLCEVGAEPQAAEKQLRLFGSFFAQAPKDEQDALLTDEARADAVIEEIAGRIAKESFPAAEEAAKNEVTAETMEMVEPAAIAEPAEEAHAATAEKSFAAPEEAEETEAAEKSVAGRRGQSVQTGCYHLETGRGSRVQVRKEAETEDPSAGILSDAGAFPLLEFESENNAAAKEEVPAADEDAPAPDSAIFEELIREVEIDPDEIPQEAEIPAEMFYPEEESDKSAPEEERDEEPQNPATPKYRLVMGMTLPLSLAGALVILAVFGAGFALLAAASALLLAAVITSGALGLASFVAGVIGGIAEMGSNLPAGLFELGLGIVLGGVGLLGVILLISLISFAVPRAFRGWKALFFSLRDTVLRLLNRLKGVFANS